MIVLFLAVDYLHKCCVLTAQSTCVYGNLHLWWFQPNPRGQVEIQHIPAISIIITIIIIIITRIGNGEIFNNQSMLTELNLNDTEACTV